MKVTRVRVCFEKIVKNAKISIEKVINYIYIFVVSRLDYEILLEQLFQQNTYISFVNINDSFLKLTIYFKDEAKYISVLRIFVSYSNNKNKNVID